MSRALVSCMYACMRAFFETSTCVSRRWVRGAASCLLRMRQAERMTMQGLTVRTTSADDRHHHRRQHFQTCFSSVPRLASRCVLRRRQLISLLFALPRRLASLSSGAEDVTAPRLNAQVASLVLPCYPLSGTSNSACSNRAI